MQTNTTPEILTEVKPGSRKRSEREQEMAPDLIEIKAKFCWADLWIRLKKGIV